MFFLFPELTWSGVGILQKLWKKCEPCTTVRVWWRACSVCAVTIRVMRLERSTISSTKSFRPEDNMQREDVHPVLHTLIHVEASVSIWGLTLCDVLPQHSFWSVLVFRWSRSTGHMIQVIQQDDWGLPPNRLLKNLLQPLPDCVCSLT